MHPCDLTVKKDGRNAYKGDIFYPFELLKKLQIIDKTDTITVDTKKKVNQNPKENMERNTYRYPHSECNY